MEWSKWLEVGVAFASAVIASGVGAYAGALYAYKGERIHRRDEERQKILQNARASLFALTHQYNLLLYYQQTVIDPIRKDQGGWLNMQPVQIGDRADWNLDFRSLGFLLGSKHGELLFDIEFQNRRFFAAVDMVTQRVSFVVNQIQPQIAELVTRQGALVSDAQLEEVLGPYRLNSAKTYASELIEHVDSAVESAPKIIDRLVVALKEIFPKERLYYGSRPKSSSNESSQPSTRTAEKGS